MRDIEICPIKEAMMDKIEPGKGNLSIKEPMMDKVEVEKGNLSIKEPMMDKIEVGKGNLSIKEAYDRQSRNVGNYFLFS